MDLFIKSQPPACAYCRWVKLLDDNRLQCDKYGDVQPMHKCRRFVYDPLKRVPPKPLVLKQEYEQDEFKID
ncbi:MAG: hypothetical protein FWE06_09315 [Oscillospiraceae bacterium]|nr:hypothetical protein [Oscillospiraceae bacterium]